MKQKKTLNMVMTAMFIAIIAIMTFVPNLGYINLIVINATIIHIPVIIGSIVLGPKNGAVLGTVFGLTSLIKSTLTPSLLSFAFSPFYSVGGIGGNGWSVVIAMVPRILVGVVPYFVYKGIEKLLKKMKGKRMIAIPIACALGTMTNTLLVMNLIYFCFRDEVAAVKEMAVDAVYSVILTIIITNGVPEMIAAVVIGTAITLVLLRIMPYEKKENAVKQDSIN